LTRRAKQWHYAIVPAWRSPGPLPRLNDLVCADLEETAHAVITLVTRRSEPLPRRIEPTNNHYNAVVGMQINPAMRHRRLLAVKSDSLIANSL